MKVLYVSGTTEGPEVVDELVRLDATLDVHVVAGAPAAMAAVQTGGQYGALFVSPALPGDESLALIASLRRLGLALAVVAILTEDQRALFASAMAAGADDVLFRRESGFLAPEETIRRVKAGTIPRIRDLQAQVQSLTLELEANRRAYDELYEAQGFARAMRDRDREELSRLRQAFTEERERRIVLEGTLRATEDRCAESLANVESTHVAARRELDEQLATAAERLHHVAHETQVLQARLQHEVAVHTAERDRFIDSDLFGYALVTPQGTVVRCNREFARMFAFDSAADVPQDAPFDGLTDQAHVARQLAEGVRIDRVETVLRRSNGRTFRALTSARLLPQDDGADPVIERAFIDLDDRTRVEEQLRLARRLETAGRLAAEMSATLDPLLISLDDPATAEAERRRTVMLVRQLLAFSRRQAKPAGVLSLGDAIHRAEPLLRQIAGDAISLEVHADDAGTVAAGDDDIEQLLAALVFTAASHLPYGGTVVITTRAARSGFDQHTELTVAAIGYGVHASPLSSSLARLVSRCGGTIRLTDEPTRTTTLHVHLPS
jgi:DNA-binding NarL/FixJ family response regulator